MSKWEDGVKIYEQELRDFLEENNLEPTEENLLNGARHWKEYSYGGNALIYDLDIAERLATPSEIKSRTHKDVGLSYKANTNETWLELQARALYQASHKIINTNERSNK